MFATVAHELFWFVGCALSQFQKVVSTLTTQANSSSVDLVFRSYFRNYQKGRPFYSLFKYFRRLEFKLCFKYQVPPAL